MRFISVVIGLAVLAAGAGWAITAPRPLPASTFTGLTGNIARGEMIFTAAGCASCHMATGAEGPSQLILSGGQKFASPFGSFTAPNISTDKTYGIGAWSLADLGNALMAGVAPDGSHLYPALPYASYAKMQPQDVADLYAYLQTLPESAEESQPHDLSFPFNIRRGLGLWKALFLSTDWAVKGDLTAQETRGRYLAEALAHCGECHTPRNALGGMQTSRWLGGAPDPSGTGNIPNITPAALTWSADEIVEYLTSGFTPDYDSVGGHMAHVVDNMSKIPAADRAAIAAYLKRVPAQP